MVVLEESEELCHQCALQILQSKNLPLTSFTAVSVSDRSDSAPFIVISASWTSVSAVEETFCVWYRAKQKNNMCGLVLVQASGLWQNNQKKKIIIGFKEQSKLRNEWENWRFAYVAEETAGEQHCTLLVTISSSFCSFWLSLMRGSNDPFFTISRVSASTKGWNKSGWFNNQVLEWAMWMAWWKESEKKTCYSEAENCLVDSIESRGVVCVDQNICQFKGDSGKVEVCLKQVSQEQSNTYFAFWKMMRGRFREPKKTLRNESQSESKVTIFGRFDLTKAYSVLNTFSDKRWNAEVVGMGDFRVVNKTYFDLDSVWDLDIRDKAQGSSAGPWSRRDRYTALCQDDNKSLPGNHSHTLQRTCEVTIMCQ